MSVAATKNRAGTKRTRSANVSEETRSLWSDGALIDLDIGWWSGRRALRPEDLAPLGINPDEVPDIYSLGRKLLVPASAIRQFRNVESRARYALDCASFGFPIASVRFVPNNRLRQLESELTSLRNEFIALRDSFLEDYQSYRDEFMEQYYKFYDALKDFYPPEDELKEKFHFTWSLFAITVPDVEQVDSEVLLDYSSARAEANRVYQNEVRKQIESFVDEAGQELRARTADICRHVAGIIRDGKAITEHSFNSLRQFIEEFRSLNFIGDMAIEEQLNNLEATWLRSDAKAVKESGMEESLRMALEAVAEKAESVSDLSEVTGAYRRKIRL